MLVKKFQDRIVKKMRRVPTGLLLTFLDATPGVRGEQTVVSQADWERYGSEEHVTGVGMAHLREQIAA